MVTFTNIAFFISVGQPFRLKAMLLNARLGAQNLVRIKFCERFYDHFLLNLSDFRRAISPVEVVSRL